MISIKDKGLLLRIIDHCKRIETKTNSLSKEMFDNDIDIKDIVSFNILQIGELAKSLSDEFVATYKTVPWKSIKGMRDKIVHRYDSIDFNRIWLVVIEDIKPLHDYSLDIVNNN